MMDKKNGRGGARPGSGRPKKRLVYAKINIAELARQYGERSLEILLEVAESGDTSASRVSAAKALLDRGYGQPVQAIKDETAPAKRAPFPVEIVKHRVVGDED